MGMWGSLVILSGLGLDDPGSNPGIPIVEFPIATFKSQVYSKL